MSVSSDDGRRIPLVRSRWTVGYRPVTMLALLGAQTG